MERAYTKAFTSILNELYEEKLDKYSTIDWMTLNNVVEEIKFNLFRLDNDNQRIKYLGTVFNEFSNEDVEWWFEDIAKVVTFTSNLSWKYDVKPTYPLHVEAGCSFIAWRTTIIYEIRELCDKVYPEIDFDEIGHLLHFQAYSVSVFSDDKIRYLRKDINKKPEASQQQNEVQYNLDIHPLVPIKIVSDFYRYCILKNLFDLPISEFDFIECFKDKVTTSKRPTFKVKNQFIYFLSKFDTINSKIANSNFGIKNYTNDKSEIKRAKPRPEITLEIDKIVKQLVV